MFLNRPLISKFFHLSTSDRSLVTKAILILIFIRLGLKFLGVKKLCLQLAKIAQSSPQKQPEKLSVYKIIWSITTASSYMPKVKCLARALAAQTLLEKQGYPVKLRIGIAKDKQQQLLAHAWVEYRGRIVIGGIGNSVHGYKIMAIEEFEKLS